MARSGHHLRRQAGSLVLVQMPLLCSDIYWRGEQGASTTRRFRSALIGSLLFHCTLAGLATAVVLQKPVLQEPVVIDLTTASLPEPQTQQQAPKMTTRSRSSSAAPARSAPLSPPPPVAVPASAVPTTTPRLVAALSAKADTLPQQTQVGGEVGSTAKSAGGAQQPSRVKVLAQEGTARQPQNRRKPCKSAICENISPISAT